MPALFTPAGAEPRFLIVRLGALGDIVHAIPVAAALRARWPDARIDWIVEQRHRPLVDMVPVVSRVVPFDSRKLGSPDGWVGVGRALRAAAYDVAFDVQGLVKSAAVARLSGARRAVGFATRELREPLAAAAYTEQVAPTGAPHVLDRNIGLLRAVGLEPRARTFPLDVPAASELLEGVIGTGGRLVLLNPGGGWPNKRWPAERFGALAARLSRRLAGRVLVLWGPTDQALAREVVARSAGAAAMAPATDLGDLLNLLRAAAVVVSGDTGPLHLASALGTPVIGIYGPTEPVRNGPWSPGDVWIDRSASCGCYHKRVCRRGDWCLQHVGVEEVVAATERVLSRHAAVAGAEHA